VTIHLDATIQYCRVTGEQMTDMTNWQTPCVHAMHTRHAVKTGQNLSIGSCRG